MKTLIRTLCLALLATSLTAQVAVKYNSSGQLTEPTNLKIPTGKTLTVESGGTLTIASGGSFTGAGVFSAGTAAAPSISFTGDTNTGFYSDAADSIGISTGGTQQWSLTGAALQSRGTNFIWNHTGSAAAPSYSFAADPDTGFYRIGANNPAVTAGGTLQVSWDGTYMLAQSGGTAGAFAMPIGAGTVSAPAYSFATDLNTGMYRTGADGIGFSTGGTNRVTIDTGQIYGGAGTFMIQHTSVGTASLPTYTFGSDTNTGIYNVGADQLGFATGGVLALTLNASQNAVFAGTVTAGAGTFTGNITFQNTGEGVSLHGTNANIRGASGVITYNAGTGGYHQFNNGGAGDLAIEDTKVTIQNSVLDLGSADVRLAKTGGGVLTITAANGVNTPSLLVVGAQAAIKGTASSIAIRNTGDSADAAITASTVTANSGIINSATSAGTYRISGTDSLTLASGTLRLNSGGHSGGVQVDQGAVLGGNVLRLTSVATNDDPVESVVQNRVATTDATETTLHTFTIASATSYTLEVNVHARRTGGTSGTANDSAGYKRIATVKDVSGTATLVGSVTSVHTAEDQAGWDCTIDVTGGTARVRVTGAADNNVTWHMTARAYSLSN